MDFFLLFVQNVYVMFHFFMIVFCDIFSCVHQANEELFPSFNIHHVNSIFSFVLFLIPYLHKFHGMFILLCIENIFCKMLCTHVLGENLKVCCNYN